MAELTHTSTPEVAKQVYTLLSIVLAVPIMLWPFLLVIGLTPAFGVDIVEYWLVSAGILLVAATVADSVLFSVSSLHTAIISALWILAASYTSALVIRHHEDAWVLALLFALHAMRSGWCLWRGCGCWWSWSAWWRDSVVATLMFLWLAIWPYVI